VLFLESSTTSVLVDAGLSHRQLVQRFAAVGREAPHTVSALIVTHSHADHAAHASTYAARLGCSVRATDATMRSLRLGPSVQAEAFAIGQPFCVGDIKIHSRRVPHDAPQVALVLETKLTTVGLVTDLGHAPKGLVPFLSECETLLLESNHDPEMLAEGPYPEALKRRVGGSLGHLSNAQAGDLLACLGQAPTHVVLMHLSETNNTPALARGSAQAALGHRGTRVLVAHQQRPLELGGLRDAQLQLGL
jgi:phosphoribosyl 1,2-cyclic phosphodiesterase